MCLPSSFAAPPLRKRLIPRRKAPPTRRQEGSILLKDPFGRKVFRWGRRFRKALPQTWSMTPDYSQLSSIQWNASPRNGYRIRFIHNKHKVAIPTPYPRFTNPQKNTLVIPKRCSLHFFPRKGRYESFSSTIVRTPPARLIGVLRHAIVLQPDRFLHKEYPCPKVLKRFRRFTRRAAFRRMSRRQRRILRKLKLPTKHARISRYALSLRLRNRPKNALLQKLAKQLKRRTIIIKRTQASQSWLTIHNL